MYRVDRNNFYDEQKNSTIYTPAPVSEFLFKILSDKIDKKGLVVDPCVGAGSLLDPFRREGFSTIGIDIEDQGFPQTIICNFLEMKKGKIGTPSLVIANPPFNIDEKTKDIVARSLGRRPLLPEAWLSKIIQLWGGGQTPIVLFAPYGLRLNQTVNSRRWKLFVDGTYPAISSIVALPKDVYSGVLFHSEILIFNVDGLNGHYFFNG